MVSPFWKEDIIIIHQGEREREIVLRAGSRLRERKRKKERATAANSHVVSILFFLRRSRRLGLLLLVLLLVFLFRWSSCVVHAQRAVSGPSQTSSHHGRNGV